MPMPIPESAQDTLLSGACQYRTSRSGGVGGYGTSSIDIIMEAKTSATIAPSTGSTIHDVSTRQLTAVLTVSYPKSVPTAHSSTNVSKAFVSTRTCPGERARATTQGLGPTARATSTCPPLCTHPRSTDPPALRSSPGSTIPDFSTRHLPVPLAPYPTCQYQVAPSTGSTIRARHYGHRCAPTPKAPSGLPLEHYGHTHAPTHRGTSARSYA
eukprot:86832-Rhodomonas_salina.4